MPFPNNSDHTEKTWDFRRLHVALDIRAIIPGLNRPEHLKPAETG
jgi:hypothetical protein